jgi:hypothetical protein
MDKSLLRSPLVIATIAIVLALIPFLFDNENILVLLRLLSFVLFFYTLHLLFISKRIAKK